MKQICDNNQCTGCLACVAVCSHKAISIEVDIEGFERPYIIEDKCVNCGLCTKTCPVNSHPLVNEPVKVFSGWSADEQVRISSSSGGAFVEIARYVIDNDGVVFGCALNDKLQAEHIYVETLNDVRSKLSGSKYVQSHIGDSYKQTKKFLQQGRKVLFSGTPCQIAGLKNYLRKEYINLITVDIICHGVPSPLIFEEYKHYMEKRENMLISDVKFRCKKSSWIFYNMTLKGYVEKDNAIKSYTGYYYKDPYIRGFLRDYFLRPSCHLCHFTSIRRCSDFTIADWWGYKKQADSDKDYACKGVSLIFANTGKAINIMPILSMEIKERSIEEAQKTNKCLSCPYPPSSSRELFWTDYKCIPFSELVEKYMRPEKVSWSVDMRQSYKNTDIFLEVIRFLTLPQRVYRKFVRIIK